MGQLSRIISILTLLKSKRILTARELAQKFDVSVRTIYRDIRKLEESGVPVITLEGVGYSLMEGYVVAPVQFSEKEANVLVTARHMVEQTNDSSFLSAYDDALTKIKSVFRTSVQEKSEKLNSKIHVLNFGNEKISSNALSEIQLAIVGLNFLEITYQKPDDSALTVRLVEPYALYSAYQRWILIAWCHLRKEYRSFRVDRITYFKVLTELFEDRQFNLQEYFKFDPMAERWQTAENTMDPKA